MRGCCFVLSFFSVWSGCWISHIIFRNEENSWAIANNNIRLNLPAWIMLDANVIFCFQTHSQSVFLPTAQHALLEDIQPLWPACPPSSTGIRVPVTLDTCIIGLFVQLFKNKSTLQSLFMLLSFWLFLRKLLAFKIFLHCLKKTRTD